MALLGSSSLGSVSTAGGKSFAAVKGLFFDRAAVQKATDKMRLKALTKCGSLVRKYAQRSMRYRKAASAPGSPPSAHKTKRLAALKKLKRAKHNGALLREMLFFAYDPRTNSVVIGPVGLGKSDVPALHEFGGSRVTKKGTVRYPARPYMRPAMAAVMTKFPALFRDTFGR